MYFRPRNFSLKKLVLLCSTLASSSTIYAATPIDLSQKSLAHLQTLMTTQTQAIEFKEFRKTSDFNNTTHIRIQETFSGYPVFGSDAVIHIPQNIPTQPSLLQTVATAKNSSATMDGIVYQDLQADLANTPKTVFTTAQAQKAIAHITALYAKDHGNKTITEAPQSQLMVYIDNHQKAHWSYQISFLAPADETGHAPTKPTYIIDAVSFQTYEQWDDIKTLEKAIGGGYGGNIKAGKLTYDGLNDHLAALQIQRDDDTQTCFLKNANVIVQTCDFNPSSGRCTNGKDFKIACPTPDAEHNNVYWNGDSDAINGGFSPSNDALYNGEITKKMYQEWSKTPVLINKDGTPMVLTMFVHLPKFDNAYWDGKTMNFGDGDRLFYPLTSLDVTAHEVSHGFTQQHSNLYYYGQSGGMNEAFSDMAGKAAEFYAFGKNPWELGGDIFKEENQALRYMDKPSKDCNGKTPGNRCSIDDASQFKSGLDVHFSSGVYNRFFYTLSTTDNWDTKKAFQVMVQANSNYWTSLTNFSLGACGVIKATKDFGYNVADVKAAFETVKVNTTFCF